MKPFSSLRRIFTSPKPERRRANIPKSDQMRSVFDVLAESVRAEWLDAEEIEKILNHPIVESAINSRKAATKSKELMIACDRADVGAEFAEILTGDLLEQVLDVPYQGMGAWELNWEERGGLWYPAPVERDYRAFEWRNGELFYTALGLPVPLAKNKAVVAFHRRKFDKPYGTALLKKLYFPVKFSGAGMDFWLKFLEKYGVPWVIGKTGGDKEDMADELYAMLSGDSAVIEEDDEVQVVTATHNGDHDRLVEKCDNYIREIILGGNLTGEVKGGSLAAAKVHNEVRGDIALTDRRIVERVFGQIIKAFLDVNALNIKLSAELRDEDDPRTEFVERDHKLYQMGYRRVQKEVEEFYGVKVEPVELPAPVAAKRMGVGRILEFSKELPEDELEMHGRKIDTGSLEEELLASIEEALNGAESYEDALKKLSAAYPQMGLAKLEESLANVAIHSRILGEAEIEDENPKG